MLRSYLSQIGVVRERPQLSRHAHRQLWIITMVLLPVILACNLVKTDTPPTPDRIVRLVLLPPVTPIEPSPPVTVVATPTPIPPSSENTVPDTSRQQDNDKLTLSALVVLDVRFGPAIDFPVIGQLQPGQTTEILGRNQEGTWWQVVYPPEGGSPAWISADPQYATASGTSEILIAQAPALPTPTPPLVKEIPTPPAEPTSSPTDEPGIPDPSTPDLGWEFANIRLDPSQYEDSLVMYGKMINNTGMSQELFFVSGLFYDGQHQLIADEKDTYDYWPVEIVPPGGQVPFELTVSDIPSATDFNLSVESEPSDKTPSPDFEFFAVQTVPDENIYCLEGMFRNKGPDLQGELVVVVVLYDNQDQVINFDDNPFEVDTFKSGDEEEFFVCLDPLGQQVLRYELLGWGL